MTDLIITDDQGVVVVETPIALAFPDSPSDGSLYGRKNNAWAKAENGIFLSGTWEELQAAGAAFEIPNGAIVECTDYPDAGIGVNSYWRVVVITGYMTLFTPLSGIVLLGQYAGVSVTGTTTEEVFFQTPIKKTMVYGAQKIKMQTLLSKSDAVNAATFRVYCGKNGDTSDALIQEIVFPAGDRSAHIRTDIFFNTESSCIVEPVKTDGTCDTAAAFPLPIGIDNTVVNDIYITVTIQNADENLETVLQNGNATLLVL